MSDHNKAVAQRWADELFNRGDFRGVKEICGDTLQFRANQIPTFNGVKQLEELVSGLRAAFPDAHYTIDEVVAEGDSVVQRWTFRGTHRGQWMGTPGTGKRVEITGTATYHFKNGKILEHVADWDALVVRCQIQSFVLIDPIFRTCTFCPKLLR